MAWLAGWDKRIKLTVDQTKIDTADLTWFPVTATLSPTHGDCVFDELTSDANRFKIAFTKADGETQLYAEIEKWDDANEIAIIHVSRDGWVISNTENTDFYMYYDIDHADNTTYISDISAVIDVGSEAKYRISFLNGNVTYIDLANPADFTGKITNIAIYAYTNLLSAKVATFYKVGNNYTARSASGNLGAVVAGAVQNFAVNLDVVVEDVIGIYATDGNGNIASSTGGGSGVMYLAGDQTACVDTTFSLYANYAISLYGTGIITGYNVWDGNFKAVYHMVDATTSTIKDSTSNINNGTKKGVNEPASIAGKVGLAQDFDGSDDYISAADSATFDFAAGFTLEAIAIPHDTSAHERLVYRYDATSKDGYFIGQANTNKWVFQIFVNPNYKDIYSNNVMSGAYQHVVGVRAADGTLNIYIDGAVQTDTGSLSGAIDSSAKLFLGTGYEGGSQWFDGIEDEVRISGIARSAAWIKATYNSLWDTLLAYGEEEVEGVEFTYVGTGTLTYSGTATQVHTRNYLCVGGGELAYSGNATYILGFAYIGSGALNYSGNAVTTVEFAYVGSGELTYSGEAVISYISNYLYTAEGEFIYSGEAECSYEVVETVYEYVGSGNFVTSGSGICPYTIILSYVGNGQFIYSGNANYYYEIPNWEYISSGSYAFSGTAIATAWIWHPIYTEPTKSNLSFTEPTKTNPVYTKPVKGTTSFTEPAKSNPIYTEPTKGHPVYTEPVKEIRLD